MRLLTFLFAAVIAGACMAPASDRVEQAGPNPAPAAPETTAALATTSPEATIAATPALTPTATTEPSPIETVAPTPAPIVSTLGPAIATPITSVPTAPPVARTRAYTTLPPGALLPSDQVCAGEMSRDPWEPRPENSTANQNNAWTSGFRLRGSYIGTIAPAYEQRVTGNFTGTTDQIIRWAACKWGFDENDVRAQAVAESTWRQAHLGDCGRTTQPETKGCASMGLMQIKGANIPATHPGTWPAGMTSTAFNVDYALAVRRLCYDGKETWLRQRNGSYAAGDLWGCIGRWFSGDWHDAAAERYISEVRATLNARPWQSASF